MKLLRKNDLFLIIGLFLLAFGIYAFKYTSQHGGKVLIYLNNELYAEAMLDNDAQIDITDNSEVLCTVVIKNGKADVVNASCPDKLCVAQQSISNNNESICCLPNRIYIVVEDDEDGAKFDAVTK